MFSHLSGNAYGL